MWRLATLLLARRWSTGVRSCRSSTTPSCAPCAARWSLPIGRIAGSLGAPSRTSLTSSSCGTPRRAEERFHPSPEFRFWVRVVDAEGCVCVCVRAVAVLRIFVRVVADADRCSVVLFFIPLFSSYPHPVFLVPCCCCCSVPVLAVFARSGLASSWFLVPFIALPGSVKRHVASTNGYAVKDVASRCLTVSRVNIDE